MGFPGGSDKIFVLGYFVFLTSMTHVPDSIDENTQSKKVTPVLSLDTVMAGS